MASSSLCEDTTCFEIQTRDLITPLEEDVIDATTSCKNTWYTPPYFGLTDLLMLLCLWSLLLRLSKLLAIQDHAQNLVEQLEIKGRGGEYYISQMCDQQRFEVRKADFPSELD